MSYIKYKKPTPDEFKKFGSETEKYRHLTAPYCTGCGVDIASQGAVVVPWAMSFDLPHEEFMRYSNGNGPKGPIHLRGFATKLPFDSDSLDFVYASHILEDYFDWLPVLTEWNRVVKIGGNLIILVPEKTLWNEAIAKGQPPNCEHRHEPFLGELTQVYQTYFEHFEIVTERLSDVVPGDYTILFCARRLR